MEKKFDPAKIISGVLQEIVLGPVLSIIFINDLEKVNKAFLLSFAFLQDWVIMSLDSQDNCEFCWRHTRVKVKFGVTVVYLALSAPQAYNRKVNKHDEFYIAFTAFFWLC